MSAVSCKKCKSVPTTLPPEHPFNLFFNKRPEQTHTGTLSGVGEASLTTGSLLSVVPSPSDVPIPAPGACDLIKDDANAITCRASLSTSEIEGSDHDSLIHSHWDTTDDWDERVSNASTYFSIGRAMQGQGDHDGAVTMLLRCLAIREKAYGKEHLVTAATYSHIGTVMNEKGDLDGAIGMFQNCLAVQEKLYGEEHASTTISYNNIGRMMKRKGDLDGALAMFQKGLVSRENIYGHQDIRTALSYGNIGDVMNRMGDLDGALDMFKKMCFGGRESEWGRTYTYCSLIQQYWSCDDEEGGS